MINGEPVDVKQVMTGSGAFGGSEIAELERAIGQNPAEVRTAAQELRDQVNSGQGSDRDVTALGVVLYLLARHEEAIEYLSQQSGNGVADFYRGRALQAIERFTEAADAYKEASTSGYDSITAVLAQAGCIRMSGDVDSAEKLLQANSRQAVSKAEYTFQLGCIYADRGDTYGAIEYFERAVDVDPHHSAALFHLASLNASFGNDDEAIQLYERALSKPPFFVGALLNLGLLYEDAERYDAAEFCFRRVIDFDPYNERARLYLKDIEATDNMWVDEDQQRREREQEQVLNTPISDFELSARSRNCLERMGLLTLGSLTRITEAELLASKNFGETSLKEVRQILDERGLRIGENVAEKRASPTQIRREDLSDEQRSIYDNPVSDLNLSVRARKCLSRLGIMSIGELMNRSPDELLGVRNFGVTSLNEIRAKLGEMGVALRND